MKRQLKYIIYQEKGKTYFAGGYVEFHRQLTPSSSRNSYLYDNNVIGGGKFKIDDNNKQIIFGNDILVGYKKS